MIKKILHITLWLVIIAGILALTGFAVENNRHAGCHSLVVRVDRSCGHDFLHEEAVIKALYDRFDTLEGASIDQGKLKQIRQMISTNPYVERTAVYRTVNNDLHIDIYQRQPIIRVVNNRNETFFIDRQGRLMPPSSRYTPRVMVAGGNVRAGYSPNLRLNGKDADTEPVPGEQILRELYQLALFIHQEPYWKAMIDQITVTPKGEFELVPSHGAHVVELGNMDGLEEKFRKLRVFYRHGLTTTGWDAYKRINLRFNKQVICSN